MHGKSYQIPFVQVLHAAVLPSSFAWCTSAFWRAVHTQHSGQPTARVMNVHNTTANRSTTPDSNVFLTTRLPLFMEERDGIFAHNENLAMLSKAAGANCCYAR